MFEGLAEIRSHGYFLRAGEEVSGRGRLRGLADAADKLSTRWTADASRRESVSFQPPTFYRMLNCRAVGGSEAAAVEVCLGCYENPE